MNATINGLWHYSGDTSCECGGYWIKLDPQDIEYGYVECVRVTDLGSGCGFTGAVEIERLTINLPDTDEKLLQALSCYGWTLDDLPTDETRILWIVDACIAYGLYDPIDDCNGPHCETLQLESDGPMVFDGWHAKRRQTKGDLRGYIESVWLDGEVQPSQ